jgi:hypothetical protein
MWTRILPHRLNAFSTDSNLKLAKPQRSVLQSVQDAPGTIGHNGGPALSDADLIREVIARGLESAIATQIPIPGRSDTSNSLLPRPLAISVKAARELIGVGATSMWALIKSGQVDVIRPCRRTLVVLTSLDAFVETLVASARQGRQQKPEISVDGNTASFSHRRSTRENAP